MNNDKPIVKKSDYVPLTEAFPHEAHDLTPWLADNIDGLADRLGLVLSIEGREVAVGDFNVDLLCKDDDGNKVIIENQVYVTNHDHLGKLLTYLVNLDAKTAIWVTSEPRPEHQKVVEWLNESMPRDMAFYLVKAEALRITASTYSPVFTVLAGPDKQSRMVGEEKKDWELVKHQRVAFWQSLLSRKAIKETAFAQEKPIRSDHIDVQAGVPDAWFQFSVEVSSSYAYLTFKFDDQEKTDAVFRSLLKQRELVDADFGAPLVWQPRRGKKYPWVGKQFDGGGLRTPDAWPALQDEMIDAMIRLDKVLRPRLLNAYKALK